MGSNNFVRHRQVSRDIVMDDWCVRTTRGAFVFHEWGVGGEPLGDLELLIEEWTNGVMNVNAIFDRAPETWGGAINQSVAINHQSIKMKRKKKKGEIL